MTYVFDNSNAEPLKRPTNREACIEQTAANKGTLEVEYWTRQWTSAFYPFQLSALKWWDLNTFGKKQSWCAKEYQERDSTVKLCLEEISPTGQQKINSQSLEDTQVEYISQKYT